MVQNLIYTLIVNSAVFSVLLLLLFGIRKLFDKKFSALLKYFLWVIVVLKLLIPFGFESAISPFGWFDVPDAQQSALNMPETVAEYTQMEDPNAADVEGLPETQKAITSSPESVSPVINKPISPLRPLNWTSWALIIWGTGFTVVLGWYLISRIKLNRHVIKNRKEVPSNVQAQLNACMQELGIRSKINVCVQSEIGIPAITGVFRPVLILPEGIQNIDDAGLRHVFIHELTHYKSGDLIQIMLMNLLSGIYWFNPLVWICFSKMRADMEVLCDQRVLHYIDNENQIGYIKTILSFAGKTHKSPVAAALSLNDGRARMENRVRGMFKPRKTKKSVAVTAAILAVLMLAVNLLTACQPTPDKAAVVNKNDGALEQAIAAKPKPEKTYEAPKEVTDSFKAKDDKVTINVDADVSIPDVKSFPVSDVVPDDITLDFAKTAGQVLMEGKTLYKPNTTLTKQDIQQQILELQHALADPKNSKSDGLNSDDPKTVADTRKLFEDRISNYQKMCDSAPDNNERKQAVFEFSPSWTYDDPALFEQENQGEKSDDEKRLIYQYENEKKFVAEADLENGYHGQITLANFNGMGLRWSKFEFVKSINLASDSTPLYGSDTKTKTNMTKDEAIALAQNTIKQLGIEDVVPDNVKANKTGGDVYGYTISFKRQYNGIPILYGDASEKDQLYGPQYDNETIGMSILNDSVANFYWRDPVKFVEVKNANVGLLPFDKIMDSFKEQMALEFNLAKFSPYNKNNPDYEKSISNIQSAEVDITHIKLGYMRMMVQNKSGAYQLVPIWKFYGSSKTVMAQNDDIPQNEDKDDMTYMTLNALDGSRVDEGLGY